MQSITQQVKVLTEQEAKRAFDSVKVLEPLWDEERHRLGSGISYYYPPALYYATSKRMNPIMRKHFDWLYEKLLQAFSNHYGIEAKFRDDLAVPGFNVYVGPTDFSRIHYNTHVDLQYMQLNWDPQGSVDFGTTMSFTLPVAIPHDGAGLNMWNVTQGQLTEEEVDNSDALSPQNAFFQRYELGIATIHDGKHYHQMTVGPNSQSGDERITLQGHGLVQNGTLVIYG